MRLTAFLGSFVLLASMSPFLVAQTSVPPYTISTVAGYGLGDGGPAKQAVLIGPRSVTSDGSGNIFIADYNQVRKVSADGTITLYAGTGVVNTSGDGGQATAAGLNVVAGLAVDRNGNLYISTGPRIRRVSTSGVITTIAGSTAGYGGDGKLAVDALLSSPSALVFDSGGTLYVADSGLNRVRKITPDGRIDLVAGNGFQGTPIEGAPAITSTVSSPNGLALDAVGNLFVLANRQVYKVDPTGTIRSVPGTEQTISTVPGTGQFTITSLSGLAVDSSGAVWVADSNHRIRKVANGVITTVAGTGAAGYGGDGAAAASAQLARPSGLTFDKSGNLLIADQDNRRIRMITPSGTISTVAGGAQDSGQGPANLFGLSLPSSVAVDQGGNLYVSDIGNNRVYKISQGGQLTTLAGTGIAGFSGDSKPGVSAQIYLAPVLFVGGLAVNSKGVYIADLQNFRIRLVSPDGTIQTIAGNGTLASSSSPPADDGPATSASFNLVGGLATDAAGALYICDAGTGRLRKVAPDGIISTVLRGNIQAVAIDKKGSIYVSSGGNIRMLAPDGKVTIIAGGGTSFDDGILATDAQFHFITGIAVDGNGNILVSETSIPLAQVETGQRIRMITPSGIITTIGGTGVSGFNGDGGLATSAQISNPAGIAVDSAGNIYFADQLNHRIRKLTPDASIQLKIDSGNLQSAVVGSALPAPLRVQLVSGIGAGLPNSLVNFKVASGAAALSAATVTTGTDGRASVNVTIGNTPGPVTVTAGAAGIQPVTFTLTSTASNIPAIASGGVITSSNFGAAPLIASGGWIEIYGIKLSDTTRNWGGADFNGVQAPTSLDRVEVLINGKSAFVQLVSPGQVNAQVPDGVGSGTATVVVKNPNGGSVATTVPSALRAPALLAPPAFKSAGKQYAVALFPDNTTFVGPGGLIAGAPFRPAKAGDHLVLYGVGFGPTTPPIPAGQVTGQANTLPNVIVKLGGVVATVEYAGLASGAVGLYQLNIVAPSGVTGDVPLSVTVDGVPVAQSLYLALE